MYLGHHYGKSKPQNKPHRINACKDYEDEQELYQVKQGDTAELRELKGKVKMLVGKLANGKKERDQLQKTNQTLQKQVMELQNNLRHMVTGFANTSSSFPMANQLTAKIAQFYKCDCLDIYFDVLAPEQLTLKGVIYFYMQIFSTANRMVDEHFQTAFAGLRAVGCLQALEGPVMNVLRKAFQPRHLQIFGLIRKEDKIGRKVQQLVDELGLGSGSRQQAVQLISIFFTKFLQILLECKICDPPLIMEVGDMGKRVQFSNLCHDPFDGFIKSKQQCFVILPQVRKGDTGDLIVKGLVLHKNYDPTN